MINMLTYTIQKCFYLQWIKKVFDATDKQQNWTVIPLWHIENLAKKNNVFYINCKVKDLKGLSGIDNEFWKEVISNYIDS